MTNQTLSKVVDYLTEQQWEFSKIENTSKLLFNYKNGKGYEWECVVDTEDDITDAKLVFYSIIPDSVPIRGGYLDMNLSTPRRQKLIFNQDVNPDSNYVKKLVPFSLDRDWLLWGRQKEDREHTIPYSVTWLSSDEKTKIIYVEDYIVGFPYLIIDGQEVESVGKLIKSHFDIYSQAEIFQQVQTSRTEKEQIDSIFRLALIAPNEFDSKFFEAFQNGFNHPSPEVRIKALKACAYTEWKEFIPYVEKIKNQDSDETVKNQAEIILKAYQSQGIH